MMPYLNRGTRWTHEQKYVYYRLKECLTVGRWEPFRPPVIGLPALVQEAAMVVRLYQSEERENPKHILNELLDRLRSSELFRRHDYAQDHQCISVLIQQCNDMKKPGIQDLEYLSAVLNALVAKMARESAVDSVLDSLRELFGSEHPEYYRIDDLVTTLANELIAVGFSERYLAQWLNQHPFYTTSFLGYLELLHALSKEPARTYSCRCQLTGSSPWTSEDLQVYGLTIENVGGSDVPAHKGTPRPLESSRESWWAAGVEVEARDPFRAAETAWTRIQEAIGLINIQKRGSQITASPKVSIAADDGLPMEIDVAASHTSQLIEIPNLQRFMQAQGRPNANLESSSAVREAAYWFHVANEVPGQVRLIALWIVLEILTNSGNSPVIVPVVEAVPAFAVMYYVPVMVDFLMSELSSTGIMPKTEEEAAATSVERQSLPRVTFVRYLLQEREVIEKQLANRDVLKRRLREFLGLVEDGHSLASHLERYAVEVEWDLRRAYRYRNWLVHKGMVPSHTLYRTLDRLTFLSRTLINGVLAILTLSPSLSISEVLKVKRQSYNEYLKLCRSGRPVDVLDEIVKPRNLFV